jgi:hypothetical protein
MAPSVNARQTTVRLMVPVSLIRWLCFATVLGTVNAGCHINASAQWLQPDAERGRADPDDQPGDVD